MRRVRTAVLISGTGSNMEALIRASQKPDYPADIQLVISNRPKAKGLDKARALGVAAFCIDHKAYDSREDFDAALRASLDEHGIELVALAGFMRILTPGFVEAWSGRMINIHPSLLPKHKGLNTHARALEAGDKRHGATVHWVSPELDSGQIIAQAAFDIPKDATPDTLAARVRPLEHKLYPQALREAALTLCDN